MITNQFQDLQKITEEHGGLILNNTFKKNNSSFWDNKLNQTQTSTNEDEDTSLNSEAQILEQIHTRGKKKKLTFNDMLMNDNDINVQQDQQDNQSSIFSGIEDSRFTKFYFQQYMVLQISCVFFSFWSIIFSVIEYDQRVKNLTSGKGDYLLYMTSITTGIIIILTIISYKVNLKLKIYQKIYSERDGLISTGMWAQLSIELILLALHPNLVTKDSEITLEDKQTYQDVIYQANDFLGLIMLIRVYFLIRVLLLSTSYAQTRSFRICKMYGADCGYFYAAKCLMAQKPLNAVVVIFILSLLIFGHGLRVTEQPMYLQHDDYTQNFGIYWNCFWNIIITMTTVGYGDYFATTLPGRLVIFFTSILGVFIVSMMVVALTNTLEMDISESKTYNVIKRLVIRKQLKEQGAFILTSTAKLSLLRKDKNSSKELIEQKISEIKQHTEAFKQNSRKIKGMHDVSNISEEIARHFDYLKEELKTISDNQLLLKDYLLKLKASTETDTNDFTDQNNFLEQFKNDEKKNTSTFYV